MSFLKALGLEDLGADEGECVHGLSLEMTAPFPAVKSCIPRRGDERAKSVATVTALNCALVYLL